MIERDVATEILAAWGRHPLLKLWRANVGVGWFANGEPARKTDPGAYPVRYGVKGQADYTGLILPSGRRLELETKATRGRQSADQTNYQEMIERMGGLYVLAPSLETFDAAMAREGIAR